MIELAVAVDPTTFTTAPAMTLWERTIGPLVDLGSDVRSGNTVLFTLLVQGILLGGIYGLVALGLTMIFGVMDVINFAHGAFLAIGMYFSYVVFTSFGLSPLVSLPLAFVALFVLGMAIERATIEPIIDAPAQSQIIITLGLWFIIEALIEIAFSPNPQSIHGSYGSFSIAGISIAEGRFYSLVVAVIAMVATWGFLYYTDMGRMIRGTADNRVGARYVGIDVRKINYTTFGIGAALAGVAGAAITMVRPFDPYTGEIYLINAFIVVVLGGLGSLPGAIVAGLIIGMVEVFGSYYYPRTMYQMLIFLIFIATLLLKPSGLFGSDHHE
ncbi:branched-chain amino acid ABC transporter permease [Halovivax gelatinilyticus]|uniref:branched-chain amino acid ABC transporter permease n=1 Tax=Halovivax gelatinilyticus TaxID=2961597 RepID=UPI0020CA7826|nr:branched-chain amino acid ABC transporter permease [Halovivax gelatinilyticus]